MARSLEYVPKSMYLGRSIEMPEHVEQVGVVFSRKRTHRNVYLSVAGPVRVAVQGQVILLFKICQLCSFKPVIFLRKFPTCSKIVTEYPPFRRAYAAESPAGPLPIIATVPLDFADSVIFKGEMTSLGWFFMPHFS